MLQVDGGPITKCGAYAACDPGENMVIELLAVYPRPLIKFVGGEVDAVLIVTKVSAVEEEQQLVAFALVGCPIDGHEALGWAVEAELFADLSAAGGSTSSHRPP